MSTSAASTASPRVPRAGFSIAGCSHREGRDFNPADGLSGTSRVTPTETGAAQTLGQKGTPGQAGTGPECCLQPETRARGLSLPGLAWHPHTQTLHRGWQAQVDCH